MGVAPVWQRSKGIRKGGHFKFFSEALIHTLARNWEVTTILHYCIKRVRANYFSKDDLYQTGEQGHPLKKQPTYHNSECLPKQTLAPRQPITANWPTMVVIAVGVLMVSVLLQLTFRTCLPPPQGNNISDISTQNLQPTKLLEV